MKENERRLEKELNRVKRERKNMFRFWFFGLIVQIFLIFIIQKYFDHGKLQESLLFLPLGLGLFVFLAFWAFLDLSICVIPERQLMLDLEKYGWPEVVRRKKVEKEAKKFRLIKFLKRLKSSMVKREGKG